MFLAAAAGRVDRTRKGRVCDVWIGARPVRVAVEGQPPVVALAAGCNDAADYVVLERLAKELTETLGGVASEPVK